MRLESRVEVTGPFLNDVNFAGHEKLIYVVWHGLAIKYSGKYNACELESIY